MRESFYEHWMRTRESCGDGATRTCVECYELFTLSDSQCDWYRLRDLQRPRRYPECRQARREQSASEQ